jgi:hypothetical protein
MFAPQGQNKPAAATATRETRKNSLNFPIRLSQIESALIFHIHFELGVFNE